MCEDCVDEMDAKEIIACDMTQQNYTEVDYISFGTTVVVEISKLFIKLWNNTTTRKF